MRKVIVFKLGPLTVFNIEATVDLFTRRQTHDYYWESPAHPRVWGPFLTISQAVEHYEATTNPPPPPPANVIAVNFNTKRRL